MTIKRATDKAGRREERAPQRSAADAYVAELIRVDGVYGKPAAEARRIVDAAAPSLTDVLYEVRREGAK